MFPELAYFVIFGPMAVLLAFRPLGLFGRADMTMPLCAEPLATRRDDGPCRSGRCARRGRRRRVPLVLSDLPGRPRDRRS